MDLKSTDEDQKLLDMEDHIINLFKAGSSIPCSETITTVDENLQSYSESPGLCSTESFQSKCFSNSSYIFGTKRRSVSFSNKIDYVSKPTYSNHPKTMRKNLFGKEEFVYTLFNEYRCARTSGTQATASINKCLQVSNNHAGVSGLVSEPITTSSNGWSSSNVTSPRTYREDLKKYNLPEPLRYSDIYFFGRKKESKKMDDSGMGPSGSKPKPHRYVSRGCDRHITKCRPTTGVQARCPSSTCGAQTRRGRVSIQEDKCGGQNALTSEMIATVSHIRIGPKEPCPIMAMSPCIGANCLAATGGEDDQAPVKVSTAPNPRRGVFELVIRRLSGAPFAKNELMLEWTPPPCRPPTCGFPCPTPCSIPICRPPKCRSVCRPGPCRPLKCCRKPCRKSCGPPCARPCGSPCRRPCTAPCWSPCGAPCGKPCPVPCGAPCGITCGIACGLTCSSPCGPPPCRIPCRRSCLRCRPACVVASRLAPCRRCCKPSPCKLSPCKPSPCSPCSPCKPPSCKPYPCKAPCKRSPCAPCPPSSCSPLPCAPSPCKSPCTIPCCNPCSSPCKSSPCLRPCPVGYRRPRRARSQPRIKAHRKRISPCYNRSRTCPVVRCRSGPCFSCCNASPCSAPCPARKCSTIYICPSRKLCPIFPCAPRRCLPYPCSRSRCCKSSCLIRC